MSFNRLEHLRNLSSHNCKKNRIGETNTANNGLMMTIIGYRGCNDIDIQFEDKIIVKHKHYTHFKEGNIKHPNINYTIINRVGEVNSAKNGMLMTIIAYRTRKDIDIQFEDGVIVKNKLYQSFKRGTIPHPNTKCNLAVARHKYLGKTNIAKNGLSMTVIEYRNYNDVDIQFEDGIIVKHKSFARFSKGYISHPTISSRLKFKNGEYNISNSGLNMKIINYNSAIDIDIQFEDGYIAKHLAYKEFKLGKIGHPFPFILNNISINKPAYIVNNVGNFYCHCPICGYKDIMTLDEIRNFRCNHEQLDESKN